MPPNPDSRSRSSQDVRSNGQTPNPEWQSWPQGNGEASGSSAGVEQDNMEGWDESEEEQDDSGTDYYALLNVARDATSNQIRSSYHTLSLRFHPDKQPAHRRDRSTLHFNNIQLAYETLINPQKRIIYDTLGVEGLKQKAFQIGVKSMSPEEFKFWLQEQVRKQRVEDVMSLVNSRGDISVSIDVSRLKFQDILSGIKSDGLAGALHKSMAPIRCSNYISRHSFTIPLEGLGEILTTPFKPSSEELAKNQSQNKTQEKDVPTLTLGASLGGVPVRTEGSRYDRYTLVCSPGLSAQVQHSFPSLPPNAPLSIASIFAGLNFEAASAIFPLGIFSTSVSKNFSASNLVLKSSFNSSPLLAPPVIEVIYGSSVGKRGTFFIHYNSGFRPRWPPAFSQLFTTVPPMGFMTIGHTIMPNPGIPTADNDGDDENPHIKRPNRSKATEIWRISATTYSVGSGQFGQLKLSWGRTYFIGTPIGLPPSPRPTSRALSNPQKEGIRMNVDTTLQPITGAISIKLRASRKIFTHTKMGVGIETSSAGVLFTINWSRLGQKIAVPLVIAPIPNASTFLYVALVPFFGYALLEGVYLRPRQYRLKRKGIEKRKRQLLVKVAKSMKKANEIVELMRESVELSQKRKKEEGGLVIIEAGYGVKGNSGEWVDVTTALAGLNEDEQVVIPRGVNKSHIPGFYDPAPHEKKELWVKYLFKGKRHEITVGNSRGLVIPMKAHCIE